jgi:hypothetical protein
MKTYIVYIKGEEQSEYIKAGNLSAAEKKAKKKYPEASPFEIQCVYTEI